MIIARADFSRTGFPPGLLSDMIFGIAGCSDSIFALQASYDRLLRLAAEAKQTF